MALIDAASDPYVVLPELARTSTIGKRLPDAVYVHVEALELLAEGASQLIERVSRQANVLLGAYNVVKLGVLAPKLSLLEYENFFEEPFPPLARSWAINLRSKSVTSRSYNTAGNAPILHRKEMLLPPDHQCAAEFRALTEALEAAGLLKEAADIGWRRMWSERLRTRGFRVVRHQLLTLPSATTLPTTADQSSVQVERHRTAIERTALSGPMQFLWRHGYLDGSSTVFDYGCGRGGDLRVLREAGVIASGWDPYFAPADDKQEADVVNLGFVLNVIENLNERRAALIAAYGLTRKVLSVGVMLGGAATAQRFQPFGDGVLTQRNTFQKYFTQEEIRSYIEATLGREPVACAPGVFFIFRTDEDEQAFLAARFSSLPSPTSLPVPAPTARPVVARPSSRRATVRERLRPDTDLLDAFWQACLALGRPPESEEFSRYNELRRFGKINDTLRLLIDERGREIFERMRARRLEDLLVFLAMNQFEKRRSQGRYPDGLRRDLRAFWGRTADAEIAARALLFSIAKEHLLRDAARSAASAGIGYLDQDHSFQIHTTLVPRLPALLRVYAACAARLYGELEGADLVKLHLGSGKVTLMFFDDFAGKAIPMMVERVKINLRTQTIDFFQYGDAFAPPPIYLKARFLVRDQAGYADQERFDQAVVALGLDMAGFGPSWEDFQAAINRKGLRIDGFQLHPKEAQT